MPKEIIVTALSNRIQYAMTNGKGDRIDITEEAIRAVFQHMKREHEMNNEGLKTLGYTFEGLGTIRYHPPEEGESQCKEITE